MDKAKCKLRMQITLLCCGDGAALNTYGNYSRNLATMIIATIVKLEKVSSHKNRGESRVDVSPPRSRNSSPSVTMINNNNPI